MLLIYSPQISNRLKYSCKLIFQLVLKLDFELTEDVNRFKGYEGAQLNYSNDNFTNSLQISPSKLLFEKGFIKQEIIFRKWKSYPVFFETNPDLDIPFDLFALCFYLASRYEEYDPNLKTDNHLRFQAEESLAFRNGFHKLPLVNLLCLELKSLLTKRFPSLQFDKSNYKFKASFDIDIAFDYLGKGVYRTMGAYARDLLNLDFYKIRERSNVLVSKRKDPFDNFEFILKFLKDNNIESQFFVNMGDYSIHDKNTILNYPLFLKRMKEIDQESDLGIHPSYKSNKNLRILKKEIDRLKRIRQKDIIRSRQHYIKMKLPETYQNLIKLGIKEDYSMGYASQLGFRASLCTPFKFYDLQKDEEGDLTIFPFCFMDGTFVDYLKLNHDEIIQETKGLKNQIQKVDGLMMGIWHNSFINNDESIKKLFKQILILCK